MGRMPRAMYLWPGLPQLWNRGAWSALAVAGGFAVLVDATLVVNFLWTELAPPWVRSTGWDAVGVAWIGSAAWTRFNTPPPHKRASGDWGAKADAFPEVLDQYLKGNWFEAECALEGLLRQDPRDLEAGLLRATLLRHTGRLDEAVGQLEWLERFEGCEKWALEIGRERRLVAQARQAQAVEPVESPNGDE